MARTRVSKHGLSRVNHGFEVGSNPHPRFTCKKLKKTCSQSIKFHHFRWSLQKKHEKRLLQTAPMLVKSNEQSLNVKFLFTSAKNWVNLGFCPKTVFSGVKPGFTFHCPSKPRFIHKPEKFPGFGGIGCICIYIYIHTVYIYTYA